MTHTFGVVHLLLIYYLFISCSGAAYLAGFMGLGNGGEIEGGSSSNPRPDLLLLQVTDGPELLTLYSGEHYAATMWSMLWYRFVGS